MTDKSYVTSRRVHSVLKKVLWPYFSEHGWKKRPGSSCAFIRPARSGYWCLWVQVSQWGGSLDGNSFTLNLVKQPKIETSLCGAEDARVLGDLLSRQDKEHGKTLSVQIQSRVPDPPPEHKIYEWAKLPGREGESWVSRLANIRESDPRRWKPGIDVWLNYYCEVDLEQWATFLLPRFDTLLSKCYASSPISRAKSTRSKSKSAKSKSAKSKSAKSTRSKRRS